MVLKTEIDNDPLGRGYAGMSDQEVLDSLRALNRERDIESISSAELYDAIDPSEYTALTATQKSMLSDIFSLSEVRIQGNTRTVLLSMFASGSVTRTSLVALTKELISRATELGLRRLGLGLIQEARQ